MRPESRRALPFFGPAIVHVRRFAEGCQASNTRRLYHVSVTDTFSVFFPAFTAPVSGMGAYFYMNFNV